MRQHQLRLNHSRFNPRPLPWERATAVDRDVGRPCVFQSAPAPVGAGDDPPREGPHLLRRFNPRPLPWERATKASAVVRLQSRVSIRARSRGSGRRRRMASMPTPTSFNPRPLPWERATLRCRTRRPGWRSFNPRPLPWERATRRARRPAWLVPVSIRARSRGSGRPWTRRADAYRWSFQSAPAPVGAGDRCRRGCRRHPPGFNPRPLPWERATRMVGLCLMTSASFNPRPLPWERATFFGAKLRLTARVSIRARSRGSGRPPAVEVAPPHCLFQSAPAPVGAGDGSPKHDPDHHIGFNPRPLPWERATIVEAQLRRINRVSIRARSRGSGRPSVQGHEGAGVRFQSAPAPVGAGDGWYAAQATVTWKFQSAPAPVGAGDLLIGHSKVEG